MYQETEHIETQHKSGPDKQQKTPKTPMLKEKTHRAWFMFSHLYDIRPRERSESILSTPEPARAAIP